MNRDSNILSNAMFYVKYPYTALVIATMWIGISIIISTQNIENYERLIVITSIATLIIAFRGFKTIK
ncbi:MAG: hypothetical protein PHD02_04905 [Bacilli bacterium]|nr:hypothetical protein [Bacilli bacterium]